MAEDTTIRLRSVNSSTSQDHLPLVTASENIHSLAIYIKKRNVSLSVSSIDTASRLDPCNTWSVVGYNIHVVYVVHLAEGKIEEIAFIHQLFNTLVVAL